MSKFLNEEPLEHRGTNGTVFKSTRCDLTSGVEVVKPARISEVQFCADLAEFGAWHSHCIWNQLNGFPGCGGICFTITEEQS